MDEQGFQISADAFRSKMQIPPGLEKPYAVAVEAGVKLLFSPETIDQTMEYMGDGQGAPQKLAQGIAAIVGMIFKESNGTMPGQLIIPVGVELIGHVTEAARKAGLEVSDADVADGVAEYIKTVLQQSGATPEQMQQALGGLDSGVATPDVPQATQQPMRQSNGQGV